MEADRTGLSPRLGLQFDLDAELFRQFLVAVSNRDFSHARDVGDLPLRAALVAQDRRDVDRRRGDARGPAARGQLLVLASFRISTARDWTSPVSLSSEQNRDT